MKSNYKLELNVILMLKYVNHTVHPVLLITQQSRQCPKGILK